MDDRWARLERVLADLTEQAPPAPAGGRLGAAIALLAERSGGLDLLLTRRHEDLPRHPGQISLPGGRIDEGETVEDAALREAAEEVGLDPASAVVLGELPAFYIPPSQFWLHTVVARWAYPHRLSADEHEVAEILVVPLAQLRDADRWRVTTLSSRGRMWAWQLDDGHLLWGATAVVVWVLLGLLDPDWSGGTTLADLPADCEVRPWERDVADLADEAAR